MVLTLIHLRVLTLKNLKILAGGNARILPFNLKLLNPNEIGNNDSKKYRALVKNSVRVLA